VGVARGTEGRRPPCKPPPQPPGLRTCRWRSSPTASSRWSWLLRMGAALRLRTTTKCSWPQVR